MDGTAQVEGLRERKKRQTRQNISDIATGLFLRRGFDDVTIAEIAEAADVSVNTVYNYFPAKEDLFFDQQDAVVERLSTMVRGRPAGEPAGRAVLRVLREELVAVSPYVGLIDGYADFMRVVDGSPALKSRLWGMAQRITDSLTEMLREETGAPPADPLPDLVAGQLAWVQAAVMAHIGRELVAGGTPKTVSRTALRTLDEIEALLSDRALDYAVKAAAPAAALTAAKNTP